MDCKKDCFKNPLHPDNNCCFNCSRDVETCDFLHSCGSNCYYWKPKVDKGRILINIPKDGNYIEILGHRIDGFESFEAFCEHLKNYAVLEETVKRQNAEIKRLTSGKCVYLSDDENTEYCVEGPCPKYRTEKDIKTEAFKEFTEAYKDQIENCTGMFTDEGFYISRDAVLNSIDFIRERLVGDNSA